MKTAKAVDQLIAELKAGGKPQAEQAWELALACTGWPYIFGDRGEYCTPAHRRAAYGSNGAEHPTIKSKCKNFDGAGSCSGCTFYPGGQTRAYDCRGFTYWVLLQIYGWKLMGAGATSQWSNGSNWKAKGEIATMPKDTLVCLFVQKGKTMEHTGFGLNDETVECSNGVQHFTTRNKKWTHWGVPACVDESVTPAPAPDPEPAPAGKPTIRKGNKGEYVLLAQTMLLNRGYRLPKYGADGDFGNETLAAVKLFQQDWGLAVDGVIGPATWQMLESSPAKMKTFSLTIHGLDATEAKALQEKYPGSVLAEE